MLKKLAMCPADGRKAACRTHQERRPMKRTSLRAAAVGVIATVSGVLMAYAAWEYLGVPRHGAGDSPDDKLGALPISVHRKWEHPLPAYESGSSASRKRQMATKTAITAGGPIPESDLYAVGEVPLRADQLPPGTPARNTPTLAPPQSPPVVAGGSRLARGARGQVIYVHVEAEEAGPAGD
jgi:hypothetical protein